MKLLISFSPGGGQKLKSWDIIVRLKFKHFININF